MAYEWRKCYIKWRKDMTETRINTVFFKKAEKYLVKLLRIPDHAI